jgi:transposase
MYVDTKSFKAGYSKTFLNRKNVLPTSSRIAIAKAYYAGMRPKELAEEYGISVQRVMSIAEWYDRRQYEERKAARKQIVAPVMVHEPEPVVQLSTVRDGTYSVTKHGVQVTLPFVSILRTAA